MIADLSVNHVERHALQCGFTVERIRHDYGVDLELNFYDEHGYCKNGRVLVQLKATDRIEMREGGASVAVTVDARDLQLWNGSLDPVILIVFDTATDRAYWLYVQAHLGADEDQRSSKRLTRTVLVPVANVVDASAMRTFSRFNDRILSQGSGRIDHHE